VRTAEPFAIRNGCGEAFASDTTAAMRSLSEDEVVALFG